MDPKQLKDWRKGLGLSQAQAASLLQKSRASVQLYEQGRAPIPDDVADIVRGKAKAAPGAVRDGGEREAVKAITPKSKSKPVDGCPPELAEAMQRKPLYAKTTAEAHAMRDELHRRALAKDKDAMRSRMPLIPLRPDWATVEARGYATKRVMYTFLCNAAIPGPLQLAATYSPRAVITENGDIYDYETACLLKRARAAA